MIAGDDQPVHPLVRSTVYVYRAVVGAALVLTGALALLLFENGLLGVRRDVAAWQERLPDGLLTAFEIGLVALVAGIAVTTNLLLLSRRMFRPWVVVNAAALAAVLLGALVSNAVLALASSDALHAAVEAAAEEGLGNDLYASALAVVTVGSVWIGRRQRPWAVGLVVAAASLSVVDAPVSVVTLPFDTGVGILAGALVALALRTRDRTPTPVELQSALQRAGVEVHTVEQAAVDARGSVPWFAASEGQGELFVKTIGADQRAADLLFRLARALRLHRSGDRRPFSSLRRGVEHEAFLSLAAAQRGVRTPQLVAVAEVTTDAMFLAYQRVPGRSLAELAPNEATDDLVTSTWRAAVDLRHAAIAHRDLRLANFLVGVDRVPWIIDFGFAELAADDLLLARDTAELMAALSVPIGHERSVAAAIDAVGADAVAEASDYLRPHAISSATRADLGRRRLTELQAVARRASRPGG